MSQEKWLVLSKKGKNFENLFISILAIALTNPKLKREDPAELIASHWLQGGGNRYFLKEEYKNHQKRLLNYLKNDPDILINSFEVYLDILRRLEKAADKVPQKDFDNLDLIEYLGQWIILPKKSLQYGYNYYWLSEGISDIILSALDRNKSQDVFADFEILSQAEQLSAIQKEKIDLLKIVENISDNNLDLSDNKVDNQIYNHLKKYAFLGQYYFRGAPWQKDNVVHRLKELLHSDWQTEKIKSEYFANNKKLTKEILEKYNFSNYELKIISLMKKMSYATNRYDEVHAYYFVHSKKLLDYISQKVGVSYVELIEMSYDELIFYIENNKKADNDFRQILVEREKNSTHLSIDGKSQIFIGSEAKKLYLQEIGEDKIANTNILNGNCACQGKVSGKVIIFESVKDLDKVKIGDIMVARATVPAFVPAMEKAAGIITEMGGLLSHAAIVSREMHIPCIVGVENATKILKTGDRVDMDANNGLIKIL